MEVEKDLGHNCKGGCWVSNMAAYEISRPRTSAGSGNDAPAPQNSLRKLLCSNLVVSLSVLFVYYRQICQIALTNRKIVAFDGACSAAMEFLTIKKNCPLAFGDIHDLQEISKSSFRGFGGNTDHLLQRRCYGGSYVLSVIKDDSVENGTSLVIHQENVDPDLVLAKLRMMEECEAVATTEGYESDVQERKNDLIRPSQWLSGDRRDEQSDSPSKDSGDDNWARQAFVEKPKALRLDRRWSSLEAALTGYIGKDKRMLFFAASGR